MLLPGSGAAAQAAARSEAGGGETCSCAMVLLYEPFVTNIFSMLWIRSNGNRVKFVSCASVTPAHLPTAHDSATSARSSPYLPTTSANLACAVHCGLARRCAASTIRTIVHFVASHISHSRMCRSH